MRIGRLEISLRPRLRDWAVARWQWPHEEFVERHKVRTALIGIQIGPINVCFWIINPGQYTLVPQERPRTRE